MPILMAILKITRQGKLHDMVLYTRLGIDMLLPITADYYSIAYYCE